ncbi:hypothetical protein [Priestia aryabhattai]|uniref:hypothetical protein n=1 Tax=Priestia aryabhattai TaxID=412384 RepID=UPI00094339EB
MKMKKSLISAVAGVSILCFSSGAFAETTASAGSQMTVESQALADGAKTIHADVETASAVSNGYEASAKSKKVMTTSTVTTHVKWSAAYATASSKSSSLASYIYVKCRTFDSDGTVIHSNSKSEKNSSYVGVKTDNGTLYYRNDWAVGNHTYKHKGKKDVVKETKTNWK